MLVGQAKPIKVWPVIRPKRIDQIRSLQRRQPGVFMQVERATLNASLSTLVSLIHGNVRTTHLKQPRERQPSRTSADYGDLLRVDCAHA